MTHKCATVKNRKGRGVRKQCYIIKANGKAKFVKNSTAGCSCGR